MQESRSNAQVAWRYACRI